FLTLSALTLATSLLRADSPLPPGTTIEQAVDHFIAAKLSEAGVTPAPRADDANLVRRLTPDLVGRIPTPAQTHACVERKDPGKTGKVVDRLMASPGFVRHQVNEFQVMLMGGTRGNLREYLQRAFAENRPWDRVFRELIVADESDPGLKGSSEFLKARI